MYTSKTAFVHNCTAIIT